MLGGTQIRGEVECRSLLTLRLLAEALGNSGTIQHNSFLQFFSGLAVYSALTFCSRDRTSFHSTVLQAVSKLVSSAANATVSSSSLFKIA